MAFSVIAHTAFAGGINGGSASAFNSTGAKIIAVATGSVPITSFTVTDNFGNTYGARADTQNGNNRTILWTCENPTVGAGHVVTITGTSVFASMCVAAFSNSLQPTSFDSSVGFTTALSTAAINTTNITPSQNGELILTTLVSSSITASPPTVVSSPPGLSFIIIDSVNFNNGVSYGSALAWGEQVTAATTSATWTEAAAPVNNNGANIACFKAAVTVVTGQQFPQVIG